MNVTTSTQPLDALDADLLVLFVPAGTEPSSLPDAFGPGLDQAAADAATSKETVLFYPTKGAAQRVAVIGLSEDGDEGERLRTAAAQAAATAQKLKADAVALALPDGAEAASAAALAEGFVLGSYQFLDYKTGSDAPHAVAGLTVRVAGDDAAEAVEAAHIRAEAACFARDLVNLSPHDKTPTLLAERAERMAAEVGLRAEVWDKARVEKENMGGLLAVNRGSQDPPVFITLEHNPADAKNAQPIVLVGKAVVFDTGGLSLKPTKGSMDHMKADMAGGAAVIGAMMAVARLGLPLWVVALIPSTDNRPGETAYVPGDVVTMRSGSTVEVLNTDAEGRMILADALDVAKQYDPELAVSVATLTGAQVVALGSRVAAVLTSEGDGAAERLAAFDAAGRRTGEWVAPLPMFAHYAEQLKSDVADQKNIGGSEAGTVTAAKFLEHFTRTDGEAAYPWVHVDIAGPAFLDSPQPYRPKGGSGFGVRLLTDLLQRRAEQ
ncbi:MAG: leucyl aminopeptidase [Rhodothermales bacterium]